MKYWVGTFLLLVCTRGMSQSQACPDNINFNLNALTYWDAYTGNNHAGNGPTAIKVRYDRAANAPVGTIGATSIFEYGLAVAGIQVISQNGIDPFGGFQTIPNINGYQYTSSVKLGSTSVNQTSTANGGAPGGYIRGISYDINVPASATGQPYTMTYAYAMVLENGTHNTIEQPLFTATLSTHDSIISCASPHYNLPTNNNAQEGGRGATLDSAAAKAEGFTVSPKLSPTTTQVGTTGASVHLQDVWTKGWTEVTFDLSAYRGSTVTLTFEADNCIPGGHFAYAYIALRNNCGGLSISGEPIACTNTNLTNSIPGLAGARYEWIIPSGWAITSSTDTSVVHVNIGDQPGYIIAHELNGCADLRDTLFVNTNPPTIPGVLDGDTLVCSINNLNTIELSGNRGSVLKWIQSNDGSTWNDIADTTLHYIAANLETTTTYRALVRNGPTCLIDTSTAATITVNPKSVGGELDPANKNICKGEDPGALLTIKGNTGAVQLWQTSIDSVNWTTFFVAGTDSAYRVSGLTATTLYRVVVKSGVCPADTSDPAKIKLFDAFFPEANLYPADTTICYGGKASLDASITIGTSYTWSSIENLSGPSSGTITAPYNLNTQATPHQTTDFVLTVTNADCPNPLVDTFHVAVLAPIIVNPGNDTSVVINQPLQLNASSSDSGDSFAWTPGLGLNNPNISNPVATFDTGLDSVRFVVTATSSYGCQGSGDVLVKIFKTGPDIFVPNAFTPGRSTNSVFRPIPVGISTLKYFRVYNRWGQLVYNTTRSGQGWDGSIDGKPQGPSTYVWMVQGIDYQGNTVTKKGVMVLIR